MGEKNLIVASLGGSVVMPGSPNVEFLRQLRQELKKFRGKCIFVIGGGTTARLYASALSKLDNSTRDQDFVGIQATQLNAELVARVLGVERIDNIARHSFKKVLISGGFEPGHSSDFDTVEFALKYGVKKVFNITNVDYVYSKRPGSPGAKPIKEMDWKKFKSLFSQKWVPGINTPFDPPAVRLCERKGIEVVFVGSNVKNLFKAFRGEKFVGTVVK